MRQLYLVILGFCGVFSLLYGQSDSLFIQQKPTIAGSFNQMAVDPLGQVVLANPAGDILKYDINGQLQFTYSNARLGELGHIDASNPFNLLLYFPEFQTILLLDRTLGERARLDLRLLDLAYTTAVSRTTSDALWVYDDWDYQLKQIDAAGEVQLHTLDLRQQLNLSTAADQIMVDKDRVYVHFPDYGLAVFNNFGQFIERIELEEEERLLQVQEDILILKKDTQFFWLRPQSQTRISLYVPPLDSHSALDVRKKGQQFFVLYPHAFRFAK